MNMTFYRKLPIPKEVKEMYPVTQEMAAVKAARDKEIKAIFTGKSEKFLLIVGPCSADKREPVLEYLGRLKIVADKVADKLVIVPRVYTCKPRTTGDGYLGLLHQPDPHKRPDIFAGLVSMRQIHMTALRDYGFSCADEMLYPDNHRYLSDLLSYTAVGARSVENQQHRLTASGLDIPVGMKNPTGGDFSVMMNAISAAHHPHNFIYRGWEVESAGNLLSHAVLRGGNDGPNYSYADLCLLRSLYVGKGLAYPSVVVDTNHDNSGKQYLKQPGIAMDVLESRKKSTEIRKLVKGLMIESYLVDGCQPTDGSTFGQSITDPCLGWEKTEKLIYEIADRV